MVSIGNGSVLQLLTWKTAVCYGNSQLPCGIQPRGASSSTISAGQAAEVCVEAAAAFGRAVWCGISVKPTSRPARMRGACAAWTHRRMFAGGARPRAWVSLASGHFLSRLNCYTPDRPALSGHFSKTAQSDGSGAHVGRPRTPPSDSNPVLTSQGPEGDGNSDRKEGTMVEQTAMWPLCCSKNTPFSTFLSSFHFMVNSENWEVF